MAGQLHRPMDLNHYKSVLEQAGVRFEPGLTDAELCGIERRYGFRFPPDLEAFLAFALPVSNGFVDWLSAPADEVHRLLAWPYEGLCFDIDHTEFWLPEWGARPEALSDAFAIARQVVDQAPTLVPICYHRYLPDRPCEAGNPVLSVWQTDIIYYGSDLWDYLEREFSYYFGGSEEQISTEPREIEFWSRIIGGAW